MAAAAFFAKLPPKLTPMEAELRDLLCQAAFVAKRLLRDAVPLQEWVERRMPGEVSLGTDASGRVTLALAYEAKGPAATAPPTAKAAPPTDAPDMEEFFASLPTDAFAAEEERLRAALTDLVAQGPVAVAQAVKDPRVSAPAKALLPRGVALEEWVERRIGAEVLVSDSDRGHPVFRLAPTGKEERREAFFSQLPEGSFTEEEEQLRSALLDFLATWKSRELANLSHVGSDKAVQHARAKLLPQGVTLRDWIERRIGGELELRLDRKGQYVVHLTAVARPIVSQRFRELEGDVVSLEDRDDREATEDARADFFTSLPADELLPAELDLRQALLDFLEAWTKRHGSVMPVLADAGQDRTVQRCKAALLPREVAIRDWIERRIGGEVQTRPQANGQVQVCLRQGRKARRAVAERSERSGGPEDQPQAMTPEEREDRKAASAATVAEKREAFFETLPPDGFTPEEEALREALLNFIEQWTGVDPPTLSNAGGDLKVRDARAAFLPKGCGVSLREWIDRRIGGEVETSIPDGSGMQVAIGLRGQLDPAAAARATRKRKADGGNSAQNAGSAGVKASKAAARCGSRDKAPIGMDPSQGPPWKKAAEDMQAAVGCCRRGRIGVVRLNASGGIALFGPAEWQGSWGIEAGAPEEGARMAIIATVAVLVLVCALV
eukprot:CAMPEP_0179050986 /NCGR_PEP_ID=MMETSP0796-20121207/21015_1 /TAXON_ID=73915 /ORGANISM="Pyrodinium bahamense, Strain pbaha01" /LENGTH=666 /DNA_ID=CAMNT_0020747519 /DNA_START=75 /DNA_END=2075 /DNA_ORIENTATION=-